MENGVCHDFIKTFSDEIYFHRPGVGDGTELHFSAASGHELPSPALCTLNLAVCAVVHACGASADCLNMIRTLSAPSLDPIHCPQSLFPKEIVTGARGEMPALNDSVNSIVSRLLVLANEVTRVSLEVGVLGIPDGQAVVPSVEGLWKVMTDNDNLMVRQFGYYLLYRLLTRIQASSLTTHITDSQG